MRHFIYNVYRLLACIFVVPFCPSWVPKTPPYDAEHKAKNLNRVIQFHTLILGKTVESVDNIDVLEIWVNEYQREWEKRGWTVEVDIYDNDSYITIKGGRR